MPSAKPPSTNGTGEDKRRNNPNKSSEERFQMEVVEDETGDDQPLGKSAEVSGKSPGTGNGVVNRAFEDEDDNKKKKGNGSEAKTLNGGGTGGDSRALHAPQQQQQQQRHHTGVTNGTNGDVEMIPLTTSSVTPTNTPTPPGDRKKAVNGQHKNASASPASTQQKSSENSSKNNTSSDLYTDYFMPVNNRRKLLRGQKLYVTRDQRANKRGWKWIAFWGGVCTFVAAALLTGILAATGIIMSKEEPSFSGAQSLLSNETDKTSATWNGTKTEDEFGGHGVILPMDPFFRKSNENLSTESTSTTTQFSPTSTITNTLEGELRLVGLDFNADFTDITSPASQDLARKIESELVKTFATMNILKAKVEQFSHGSVIVHFLLTWPDHVYLVTPEQATTYFTDHLSINGDNLGEYRLDPNYFTLKELSNRCEEHNGGCGEICHWSSSDLKFMCTCSDGRMLDTDGKSCVPLVSQSHPTTDDHTSSYENTVTMTATTPRSTSASRGRQLIFGVDDDMMVNDTFASANESTTATTPEPIHDAEPEPPETTATIESTDTTTIPDTYNTHFAFGLDVLNTSTSVTTWGDTQYNDTAFVTTSSHEIGLHQIPIINDTAQGSQPFEEEDYSNFSTHNDANVQNITDPTISFTITTSSSHEMEEEVNFTSPAHPTKDDHHEMEEEVTFTSPAHSTKDDHLYFGLNVSHVTDADATNDSSIRTTSEPDLDNVTTHFNYTDIATVSHVISRSDDVNVSSEQPFSTLHTENDNFTMTMMVTKSESEETVSLSNHSTGHGWDRFSHMLTTLNEAMDSDSQTSDSPITAVTDSYLVFNSTSESQTEISIPQSAFDNVTSDFNVHDMARMLPGFDEELDHTDTDTASTPRSLPEPMVTQENQTEPTSMVTLSNITSGDADTEDPMDNVTTPWTAVSYRHLYQHNNTEQDWPIPPTATEVVNMNSTVELITEDSSISQTLRHLTITNATATTEEPLSTLSAENDTAQSSSTHNETVISLFINSTDYLTGFSNHETSQATNLTTEASDTEE